MYTDERLAQFEVKALACGQFVPVMRFALTDDGKRHFKAERMCDLGSIDDWIALAFNKSIEELARSLIPALGSDEFFELF